MKSTNILIGPMEDNDSWLLGLQIKFGPNTTDKLEDVILFKSLRSIT
jgi:hypothetical protein